MDENFTDSVSSMVRLNDVLSSVSEKISLPCQHIKEFLNNFNESFSKEGDFLIPEENHKQLENSLEILCRLPNLFLQLGIDFQAFGVMDTYGVIQKYKKIAATIEETNNKLTEMADNFENVINNKPL